VLAAISLRTPVGSLPPVVDEVSADLDLSAAAAGLLTTAPVLCFGLFAPAAPLLARRLGGERVLLVALVPIVLGLLLRGVGAASALFAGTLLAGAGIAVGNVIVPAVLKGRFGTRVGLLTGLYTAALSGGAALAAGLTVPISQALDLDWPAALAVWAAPAVVALAVLAAALARTGGRARTEPGSSGAARLLGEALAWQVTVFMGLQSLVFYACLAWLPSILRDDGYRAESAGALLALYAVAGIPASLLVPIAAARAATQRPLVTLMTAAMAAGLCGLLLAPEAAVVWVALLATAQGGAFGLALTLIVLRSPDPRRAAELSGMAQAIGYGLAAAGPLTVGVLRDATGTWTAPLVLLLALTVPLLAAGLGAGRDRFVAAGDTPARVTP